MHEIIVLRRRIRLLIVFFMLALVASGLTASFPLEAELGLLDRAVGEGSAVEAWLPSLARWISYVHDGVTQTYSQYPFMAYGTDWLAFAHIVIAVAFIGPLRDPVKNVWVIEFGMIACLLVIPLALICGPMRGIPWFWCLVDCSFGIFGVVPLLITRRYIKRLEALQ